MDHRADVERVEVVVDELEVVAARRWGHAADQLEHSCPVGLLHAVAHIVGNGAFKAQGRDRLAGQPSKQLGVEAGCGRELNRCIEVAVDQAIPIAHVGQRHIVAAAEEGPAAAEEGGQHAGGAQGLAAGIELGIEQLVAMQHHAQLAAGPAREREVQVVCALARLAGEEKLRRLVGGQQLQGARQQIKAALACELLAPATASDGQVEAVGIDEAQAGAGIQAAQASAAERIGSGPDPAEPAQAAAAVEAGGGLLGSREAAGAVGAELQRRHIAGVKPVVHPIGIGDALAGEVAQHLGAIGVAVGRSQRAAQFVGAETALQLVGEALGAAGHQQGYVAAGHQVVAGVQLGGAQHGPGQLAVVGIGRIHQAAPVADQGILLVGGLVDHRDPFRHQSGQVVDAARAEHGLGLAAISVGAGVGVAVVVPHHGVAIAIAHHHKQRARAPLPQMGRELGGGGVFDEACAAHAGQSAAGLAGAEQPLARLLAKAQQGLELGLRAGAAAGPALGGIEQGFAVGHCAVALDWQLQRVAGGGIHLLDRIDQREVIGLLQGSAAGAEIEPLLQADLQVAVARAGAAGAAPLVVARGGAARALRQLHPGGHHFSQGVGTAGVCLGIDQIGDQGSGAVPGGHHQLAVDGHQIGRVGFTFLQLQAAKGGDVEPVLAVEAAGGDAHPPIRTDIRLVGLVGDRVVGEAHHPLHRAGEGAALAGGEVAAARPLHLVHG